MHICVDRLIHIDRYVDTQTNSNELTLNILSGEALLDSLLGRGAQSFLTTSTIYIYIYIYICVCVCVYVYVYVYEYL